MSDHKTLGAALAAAQANMKDPRLTGTNPHFDSKFVPRDEALDCVLPALLAEGIALSQAPVHDEFGYGVRTMLHWNAETFDFGAFTIKPSKDDPQGAIGATTYASRVGIMLVFARAGDPDDDGNAASEKPKPEPIAEKPRESHPLDALNAIAKANKTAAALKAHLGNPSTVGEARACYDALSEEGKTRAERIAEGADK